MEPRPDDLQKLLGNRWPSVGIAFRDAAPPGIPRAAQPAPAGCGYWRAAADGAVFFTEASDHYGCPIGLHTMGIPMPPQQAAELQTTLGTMFGLGYLKAEEVAGIPRRTQAFGVAIYGPVAALPVEPDVVLVRGSAHTLMLLAEAAQSAGLSAQHPALGRPTCAVLPQALSSGRAETSLGCIGNRVYTGLGEGEAYTAVPAAIVPKLVVALGTLVRANAALEQFHRARL